MYFWSRDQKADTTVEGVWRKTWEAGGILAEVQAHFKKRTFKNSTKIGQQQKQQLLLPQIQVHALCVCVSSTSCCVTPTLFESTKRHK